MMKTAVLLMYSLVTLVWANPLHFELQKRKPTGRPEAVPFAKPRIVSVNIVECLDAHNDKRALHGAPRLQWDENLASGSAKWALYLASKPSIQLEKSTSSNYGENIYYVGKLPLGTVSSCIAAVNDWYDEIEGYNFNKPGYSSDTGHFTQVVWKSSTRVGVGIAAVNRPYNGKILTFTYVVARYAPPGNIDSPQYFRDNVLRLNRG